MLNEILGELLTEVERQKRMRVRLEDRIRHTTTVSTQLCELTLYENYTPASGGDPKLLAIQLAAEAILIAEKLS